MNYWRTPKTTYEKLDAEFHFDFDPCPCPRPDDYDSLIIPWGRSNFVNPPFRKHDGVNGQGPTAFVRKAIEEQKQGRTSVLLLPVQSYVNLLLEAGAELRSMGRLRFEEIDTGEPQKDPSPICCFVLRGNRGMTDQRWQQLMGNTELNLSEQEISEGWHWCNDFDGLLVGPSMDEQRFCHCTDLQNQPTLKPQPELEREGKA